MVTCCPVQLKDVVKVVFGATKVDEIPRDVMLISIRDWGANAIEILDQEYLDEFYETNSEVYVDCWHYWEETKKFIVQLTKAC